MGATWRHDRQYIGRDRHDRQYIGAIGANIGANNFVAWLDTIAHYQILGVMPGLH